MQYKVALETLLYLHISGRNLRSEFQQKIDIFGVNFFEGVGDRFWLLESRPEEDTPPTLYFFESSFHALSNARNKKSENGHCEKIWASKVTVQASEIANFHQIKKNAKDRIPKFIARGGGRRKKNFCTA